MSFKDSFILFGIVRQETTALETTLVILQDYLIIKCAEDNAELTSKLKNVVFLFILSLIFAIILKYC